MRQSNPLALPQPSKAKGLINGDITPAQPLGGTGYEATQRGVDPATQTVAGQVDKVIAADSPLMQGARTRATQTANKRGLLNSSMAVQAGEEAVHAAALPIANADASIYNDVSNRNMEAVNRAEEFGAGARNTLGQIGAQGEQQRLTQAQAAEAESRLLTQKAEIDRQMQSADAATKERLMAQQGVIEQQLQALKGSQDIAVQGLRGEQATQVANIEAQYKQLMQTQDSVSRFFAQTQDSISKVLAEPNINVEGKNALVQKLIDSLKNYMAVSGPIANLDLSRFLNFGGTTPASGGTTTTDTGSTAGTPPALNAPIGGTTAAGGTTQNGETRTNPTTGAREQWNGSAWVPVEESSDVGSE